MVCSLGSGRMAAMARLLSAGVPSQTIAEEVGHQKLAIQYIRRELREADEANLLDEEDMHVFGLKPMSDPLHLVCCNACKKPVKASQYAAHAELCNSLSSAAEIVSKVDGCTGQRKPPKKEKKKLLTSYANHATSVGGQERCVSADGMAIPEPHVDKQIQMTSFSIRAKYAALTANGSGVNPGNVNYSSAVIPPPIKRSKLIGAEGRPLSCHLETATAVTTSLGTSTQEALTGRIPRGSSSESKRSSDHIVGCQKPSQPHQGFLLTQDIPAPLATKVFYSQRKHRLRSALTRLYYEASSEDYCRDSVNVRSQDHGTDLVDTKLLQGNSMSTHTSRPKNFSPEQTEDLVDKRDGYFLPSVRKPEPIFTQNSELQSGGCQPGAARDLSNHAPVNSVLRPHIAPVRKMRSNFLSQPYSFAGNSGRGAIDTMQQSDGSVPVI